MKETLKILREKNRYSQNLISSLLGISRQMYIKYESGEVEPPVHVVKALARLHDVPYEVIIDNVLKPVETKADEKKSITYDKTPSEQKSLSVAEPAPAYGSTLTPPVVYESSTLTDDKNMYYDTILQMIEKLSFGERLHLMSKLAQNVEKDAPEDVQKKERRFGFGILKDKIWMADDFDETPPGFEDYM